MPVTSSSLTRGPAQADGRQWVTETHETGQEEGVTVSYLAPSDFNAEATMAERVPDINEALAVEEADEQFDRDEAMVLFETDKRTFLLRFRQKYRDAEREDACRLAHWFARRLAAGHITDVECRQAFGLTNTQWNNFKTNKLSPQHDAWAAVLAATGG